ncbi:MAG: 2-oxoacid:acceptor oxidoreductase family protein [Nanoarchaeota archaeon]|nr:2-oxoacid:acceptor oxidoreductase family protein [Nanoarchaeota archaeon]
MKDIFEIRIHGRGGQGAKTASQFIAEAALGKGKFIQSFPEYGPERAGAPMKAFARISDKPIHSYAPVVNPDVVMVIDPTLLETVNVADGLSEDGVLIVNTPKDTQWAQEKTGFKGKCMAVDATKIAFEAVGKNLPNTPMIGALIKATNCITLDAITESIKKKFLKKLGEEKTQATIDAVKKAHDEVK